MKTFGKFATLALAVAVISASAMAQAPATTLTNLIDGSEELNSSGSWGGYSSLTLIPGAGLFGVTSTQTVLTIVFTAGSTVDVGNMILYTSARGSSTITGTKKVTLGGISNPSINLTSTSVCPVQPVSTANPCYVKLDPIKGSLVVTDDYTFTIYFLNDSNNATMEGAGTGPVQGSLSAWAVSGDQTRIKKKGTLPSGNAGEGPPFLMYVTNE